MNSYVIQLNIAVLFHNLLKEFKCVEEDFSVLPEMGALIWIYLVYNSSKTVAVSNIHSLSSIVL